MLLPIGTASEKSPLTPLMLRRTETSTRSARQVWPEHRRTENRRRRIAGPDPRGDRPVLVAHQVHDRALDHDLRRFKPTAQQRAEPKARRHFGKARQRLATRQRHVDILGPQIELMGVAVDPETDARNRHFEPDPGTLERALEIGREPIQLDRALHHPPDAKQREQDQNRGDRAEPAQHMVCAAPDMAHRPVVQQPAAARRGIRLRGHGHLRPLTGLGRWASVAALAGIMR
jgi:hypothetical protein